MKPNSLNQYIDHILIGISIILTFISLQSSIGRSIFMLLLALIAIYFFPIKLILRKDPTDSSDKVYYLLSCLILGNLIALAALANLFVEIQILRYIYLFAAALNFGFVLVIYFRSNNRKLLHLHLIATFLASVALYA
jgi:hypothetical protein